MSGFKFETQHGSKHSRVYVYDVGLVSLHFQTQFSAVT